jgi:hypothetical protein
VGKNKAWDIRQGDIPERLDVKEETMAGILRQIGDLRDAKLPDGTMISRKEALARRTWDIALKGDLAAIKFIYEETSGDE